MSSRRESFCTSACSTKSNGACTPAWSLSNSSTAAIGRWRSFWVWTLIRWAEDESSCWPGSLSGNGLAGRDRGGNPWKKNARGNRANRRTAGIQDRRRSHETVEVDTEDAAQNCGGAPFLGDPSVCQHRGKIAARNGLLLASQPQGDCRQFRPRPERTDAAHRQATLYPA